MKKKDMKKKIYLVMSIILTLVVYIVSLSLDTNDGKPHQNLEEVYSFRTEELLNSHYQKHGSEFGNISKEEYLLGANNLINSSFSDVLTKYEEEDGDKIYYSENTNEFLVLSTDGYIRTYFKPDDGIAYYKRQ